MLLEHLDGYEAAQCIAAGGAVLAGACPPPVESADDCTSGSAARRAGICRTVRSPLYQRISQNSITR